MANEVIHAANKPPLRRRKPAAPGPAAAGPVAGALAPQHAGSPAAKRAAGDPDRRPRAGTFPGADRRAAQRADRNPAVDHVKISGPAGTFAALDRLTQLGCSAGEGKRTA